MCFEITGVEKWRKEVNFRCGYVVSLIGSISFLCVKQSFLICFLPWGEVVGDC